MTITIGGEIVQVTPVDGVYTIDGDLIVGDVAVSVTVSEIAITTVSSTVYGSIMSGTKIIVIKSEDNDTTYSLDDYNFYFCEHLGGYAAIVPADLSDDYIAKTLAYTEGADADEVTNNGDLDGDGFVSAGDAAIISEMIHKKAAGAEANAVYTDAMRLCADVYGDGNVTATDATAVLYKSVGLVYTPDPEEDN